MVETKSLMKIKSADVEKLVVELAKKNTPSEKIGLILRDQHGIPKVKLITKKKIQQILKENNLNTNSEYENVSKKINNLRKHVEKNTHDYTAKRKIVQKTSNLRKIKR